MKDKQPTEAQIKEFWEWCGLICFCSPEDDMYHRGIWNDKDGLRIDTPPIDLTNLFKYAVPQTLEALAKKGYAPPLMKLFQLWYDKLVSLAGDSSNVQYAALALFWVIWEVIKGKQ